MSKERPHINHELVASEEMTGFARVLRSVVNGRGNVMETDDWTVQSLSHSQYAVDCVYHPAGRELAVFTFAMAQRNKLIEMENTHRRAHKGSGVTTISYIEHMAAALSDLENMPVRMTYPLYGQADTQQFLLRRGYSPILYFSVGSMMPVPALSWTYGA